MVSRIGSLNSRQWVKAPPKTPVLAKSFLERALFGIRVGQFITMSKHELTISQNVTTNRNCSHPARRELENFPR
jgi:hypothetical protein